MSTVFMLVIVLLMGSGEEIVVHQCWATAAEAEQASLAFEGAEDVVETDYWEVHAGFCRNDTFSL